MTRILVAAGFVGGALVAVCVFYLVMQAVILPAARTAAGDEARARLIAEQAAAAQREELERKGDDAKLQRMSDLDLCREYLGRVRECEALRADVQPVSEE